MLPRSRTRNTISEIGHAVWWTDGVVSNSWCSKVIVLISVAVLIVSALVLSFQALRWNLY